jgi:2-hydroxychromene-2-carboxylate isomerase
VKTVEFFFDYTCPYAYLASTQIEALCARTGSALEWRPMLLGGLFRSIGTATNLAATLHPAKARMLVADQRRWANLWGVELSVPRPGGYARSVEALRATLVVLERQPAAASAVIGHLYRAHWVTHRDIGDPAILRTVLDEAGVDGSMVIAGIDQRTKAALQSSTDEAARRGAFGAPAMFVGDELYFGQDRLAMLERALGGEPVEPGAGRFVRTDSSPPTIEFFYDPSSPFAYLGSYGLKALAARSGARIIWRPILLGGLFKALGGPTVPLETFSENKQRFVTKDLERWARLWGAPYRWNSQFPVRTLRAQRIAAALCPVDDGGDVGAVERFSTEVFRSVWERDEDPDADDTLARCLTASGLDRALIARASDPAVKQALIERTQIAMDAGAFGVPTFRVGDALFWGQDRLSLVERALEGWNPPSA